MFNAGEIPRLFSKSYGSHFLCGKIQGCAAQGVFTGLVKNIITAGPFNASANNSSQT